MAQSSLKKKQTSKFILPTQKKGKSSNKKSGGVVKKGKAKAESAKVKKTLQKVIGRKIEEELVSIATDKGNNFKILNTAGGGTKKKLKSKQK